MIFVLISFASEIMNSNESNFESIKKETERSAFIRISFKMKLPHLLTLSITQFQLIIKLYLACYVTAMTKKAYIRLFIACIEFKTKTKWKHVPFPKYHQLLYNMYTRLNLLTYSCVYRKKLIYELFFYDRIEI